MIKGLIILFQVGQALVDDEHPQAEEFQEMITDLNERWNQLRTAVDDRKERLELSEVAQQVRPLL